MSNKVPQEQKMAERAAKMEKNAHRSEPAMGIFLM
jgi:hypothetical protein